jgi:hypothetical protein
MHGYFSAEKFLVLVPVALARHYAGNILVQALRKRP